MSRTSDWHNMIDMTVNHIKAPHIHAISVGPFTFFSYFVFVFFRNFLFFSPLFFVVVVAFLFSTTFTYDALALLSNGNISSTNVARKNELW